MNSRITPVQDQIRSIASWPKTEEGERETPTKWTRLGTCMNSACRRAIATVPACFLLYLFILYCVLLLLVFFYTSVCQSSHHTGLISTEGKRHRMKKVRGKLLNSNPTVEPPIMHDQKKTQIFVLRLILRST
jgi:hypothetical protein